MKKKNENVSCETKTEETTLVKVDNTFATVAPTEEIPLVRFTTTESNSRLFNATNGSADIKIADVIGQSFDIVDIVITSAVVPVNPNEENSEKVNKPCVHFFTADGIHISSIANGIIRSVKNLIGCGLVPTKENPVKIIFKTTNTKRGIAHTFDMCD